MEVLQNELVLRRQELILSFEQRRLCKSFGSCFQETEAISEVINNIERARKGVNTGVLSKVSQTEQKVYYQKKYHGSIKLLMRNWLQFPIHVPLTKSIIRHF